MAARKQEQKPIKSITGIPAACELVVDGKKVVGCAQTRRGGAVLIHAAILFGLDVTPASLPADVPAQAMQLWADGLCREALSLLYRTSLSRLIDHHQIAFRASHGAKISPAVSAAGSRRRSAKTRSAARSRAPERSSTRASQSAGFIPRSRPPPVIFFFVSLGAQRGT